MIVISGLKKIYRSGRTQTAALDGASGESLMQLLKAVSAQRLVVIVTHDRDFAARFDCLVCAAFEWWAPLLILGIVLAVTFGVTWLALAAKLRKK